MKSKRPTPRSLRGHGQGIGDIWTDIQNAVPSLLPAILGSGLLDTLFRTMFPEGAPITFEIPRYTSTIPGLGLEVVVCPEGGCGGQLVVQRVEIRPVTPSPTGFLLFHVTFRVSVDSRNALGQRSPLPIHAVGDVLVDIDTTRGARRELAFTAPLYVAVGVDAAAPSVTSVTKIRPELVSIPASIWLGPIAALPGFEVEPDDLTLSGNGLTGRILTSGINLFKQKLVELIRSELEYSLNRQVCTRYGVTCPPQFDLRPVEVPSISETVSSAVTPGNIAVVAGGLVLLWAIFK